MAGLKNAFFGPTDLSRKELYEAEPINVMGEIPAPSPTPKTEYEKNTPATMVRENYVTSPITPRPKKSTVESGKGIELGTERIPSVKDPVKVAKVQHSPITRMESMPEIPPTAITPTPSLSQTPVRDPVEQKLEDAEAISKEANSNFDWSELLIGAIPSALSLISGSSAGYKIGGKAMMDRQNSLFELDNKIKLMEAKRAIAGDKDETKHSKVQYTDPESGRVALGTWVQPKHGQGYVMELGPGVQAQVNSLSQNIGEQTGLQSMKSATRINEAMGLGKDTIFQKMDDDTYQAISKGRIQGSVTPEQVQSMLQSGQISQGNIRGTTAPVFNQTPGQPIRSNISAVQGVETPAARDAYATATKKKESLKEEVESYNDASRALKYLKDPDFANNIATQNGALKMVARLFDKGVLTDYDVGMFKAPIGWVAKSKELIYAGKNNKFPPRLTADLRQLLEAVTGDKKTLLDSSYGTILKSGLPWGVSEEQMKKQLGGLPLTPSDSEGRPKVKEGFTLMKYGSTYKMIPNNKVQEALDKKFEKVK